MASMVLNQMITLELVFLIATIKIRFTKDFYSDPRIASASSPLSTQVMTRSKVFTKDFMDKGKSSLTWQWTRPRLLVMHVARQPCIRPARRDRDSRTNQGTSTLLNPKSELGLAYHNTYELEPKWQRSRTALLSAERQQRLGRIRDGFRRSTALNNLVLISVRSDSSSFHWLLSLTYSCKKHPRSTGSVEDQHVHTDEQPTPEQGT
ncbi:uncharacterized protein HD556DRAFT_507640 [Suillus plorans]|uniref:Uncharacterized protein n=1 Tax=Suillus plorans TaxID=116603 RepID=A0A9P7AP85_9AGAM|nr:uncharacterized protein HD556DRAFT_507640 [Suillus plorans]KAG1793462.1 hypothetical protein HD556DRAFT_507640 [Suillus plorans]